MAALLATIERGSFDLSDRLSSGDVDSLRALREELQAAKRQCSEKIKRLLHADYPAFIAASKVIGCHQPKLGHDSSCVQVFSTKQCLPRGDEDHFL